jgi:hypothetical protein
MSTKSWTCAFTAATFAQRLSPFGAPLAASVDDLICMGNGSCEECMTRVVDKDTIARLAKNAA